MKTSILAMLMLAVSFQVLSQDESTESKVNVGFGMGIDYGGFGGRLTFLPVQQFGIFAGLGYNLVGAGINVGSTFRFLPSKRVCPTVGAMYGYNGVIKVLNASEYNKIYYGFSLSGGAEFRFGGNKKNYLNVELIVPFRPQAFYDQMDALKNNSNINFQAKPLPVGFSVGYHIGF